MNAHHDWVTVIFCGEEALLDERLKHFQRVITHSEAAGMIGSYPDRVFLTRTSELIQSERISGSERG